MPRGVPAVGGVWDELEVSFPLRERVRESAGLIQQVRESMDDDRAIRREPRRLLVMDDRKVDLPVIRIETPGPA